LFLPHFNGVLHRFHLIISVLPLHPISVAADPNILSISATITPRTTVRLRKSVQQPGRIIWTATVQSRVHNSPPLLTILRDINPVYALPSHLIKTNFKMRSKIAKISSRLSASLFVRMEQLGSYWTDLYEI
jgi:hypothetical protein